MKRKHIFLLIISIFFIFSPAKAQQERKHIRAGNENYEARNYGNAIVAYEKAIEEKKNSFEAAFNIGNTYYKQGKYEEAIEQFKTMAATFRDNKSRLAEIYHNIGNAYYKMKKLDESIEAYKEALRNNPNDEETRYNLKKLLKKKQQQQQQQDKNNDKNKKDNNQNEDQKQKQDKNKNKDKKEEDQKQDSQQNKKADEQNQPKQPQPQQISKEDAERILNNLERNEKQIQNRVKRAKAKQKVRTDKDW